MHLNRKLNDNKMQKSTISASLKVLRETQKFLCSTLSPRGSEEHRKNTPAAAHRCYAAEQGRRSSCTQPPCPQELSVPSPGLSTPQSHFFFFSLCLPGKPNAECSLQQRLVYNFRFWKGTETREGMRNAEQSVTPICTCFVCHLLVLQTFPSTLSLLQG